jgi:hypothetical protein
MKAQKLGFILVYFYHIFIIFWWLLPRRSPLRSVWLSSRWLVLRVEEEKRKEKEGRGDGRASTTQN